MFRPIASSRGTQHSPFLDLEVAEPSKEPPFKASWKTAAWATALFPIWVAYSAYWSCTDAKELTFCQILAVPFKGFPDDT